MKKKICLIMCCIALALGFSVMGCGKKNDVGYARQGHHPITPGGGQWVNDNYWTTGNSSGNSNDQGQGYVFVDGVFVDYGY